MEGCHKTKQVFTTSSCEFDHQSTQISGAIFVGYSTWPDGAWKKIKKSSKICTRQLSLPWEKIEKKTTKNGFFTLGGRSPYLTRLWQVKIKKTKYTRKKKIYFPQLRGKINTQHTHLHIKGKSGPLRCPEVEFTCRTRERETDKKQHFAQEIYK